MLGEAKKQFSLTREALRSTCGCQKTKLSVAATEGVLACGDKALGVANGRMQQISQVVPEKLMLAWRLCEPTTVPLQRVTEHWQMGDYTCVKRANSRMRNRPGRKLQALLAQLLRALNQSS